MHTITRFCRHDEAAAEATCAKGPAEAAVLHGKREIPCTAHALQQIHGSE